MTRRRLGQSDLEISAVALGCWPLAGITSGAMTGNAAVEVVNAALELGVNHLDTAFAYGRHGESERRIARALRGRRHAVVLATKVGVIGTKPVRCGKPDGPNCCAGSAKKASGVSSSTRWICSTSIRRPGTVSVIRREGQ